MSNADLIAQAADVGEHYPPRTPGRRAAAACWVALVTTKTVDGARRSLGTIPDPDNRAAAVALFAQLERSEQEADR